MTTTTTYQEQTVEVAGGKIHLMKQGSGAPLLFLHHSISNHGWLPIHNKLAEQFTVYVPDMPGWGDSDRPDWARDVRDIAILLVRMLDRIGAPKATIVGTGLGGWVAAEMLTMAEQRFDQAVLIGAVGIKPRDGTGDIVDQLMVDYEDYVRAGFVDEAAFLAAFGEDMAVGTRLALYGGREMTMRITSRPWMFRWALPQLLSDVQTPTLVLAGEQDKIVPVDVSRQYAEALPNSQLEVVSGAGHFVEIERADSIASLITAHRAKAVK